MGMMQNKVNRRIALGSIVGGLAGTVAILQTLKSWYPALPDDRRKYVADWERNLKLVDVPIKEMDGPSTFVLDYKPQVDMKFRAACLYASYEQEDYPKPPNFHSIADGQLTVRSPIVGDRSALLVASREDQTFFTTRESKKKPTGECFVVPKIVDGLFDGFSYYAIDDTSKELLPADVNSSCCILANAVMFNYPPGRTLVKGAKWTVPENLSHSVELPCEVVGFAEIAGRKTAKVFAEQRLDDKQYQHYVVRSWQVVKELGYGGMDAQLRDDLNEAVRYKLAFDIRVTFFVDLSLGICIRNEAVTNLYGRSYDRTVVQVSQVFNA